MGTDLSQPPLQLFLALINRTNRTLFVAEDLVFGAPQAISGPGNSYYNTTISVSGTGTTRFVGPQSLRYRRLLIGGVFEDRDNHVELPYGSANINTATLINTINAMFGFALSSSDFENETWTLNPVLPNPIALTAATNSRIFIGQVALILTVADQPPIEDDMYFKLLPDKTIYEYDSETQALAVRIGGTDGYPMTVISSDPEDYIMRQIENESLDQLTLVSARLYTMFNTEPNAADEGRSEFVVASKAPYARPVISSQIDPPVQINTLTRGATALQGVVLLNAPGNWWESMTPGHHGLIVHAVFEHPNFAKPIHYHFYDETPYFVPNT